MTALDHANAEIRRLQCVVDCQGAAMSRMRRGLETALRILDEYPDVDGSIVSRAIRRLERGLGIPPQPHTRHPQAVKFHPLQSPAETARDLEGQ